MLDKTDSLSPAARARALLPDIRAAAASIEASRQVPATLMAKMHDAGLFRMLLPRSVGGSECHISEFVAAVEEIAKADASTAWCVGQGSGVSFGAAFLDLNVAREIFAPADAVMASGPNAPKARAVVAPGGYRITGDWRFASGSRNAQWLGGHCTVVEADGAPRPLPPGKGAQIIAVFRKDRAVMSDVWRVMGLHGTGSDDYSAADLFVPEEYTFTRDWIGDRRENGTLYRFSNFNMFGFAFAGIGVGLARAMMDDFANLANAKKATHATQPLSANAAVQQQFGFNEARLQAARAYLYDTLNKAWDKADGGAELTGEDRLSLRMMSAYVIQTSKDVVDFVYHAAGATAIFADQPFERRFRDMHVVTQQGQAHLTNFEVAGKLLFEKHAVGLKS